MNSPSQLIWPRWQPLTAPPRRLLVLCSQCHRSAVNEDKALSGWQQTSNTPRRYRCPDCSQAAA